MAEKKTKLLCIKVKPSTFEQIEVIAEKENKNVSEFVRDTILNKIRRS